MNVSWLMAALAGFITRVPRKSTQKSEATGKSCGGLSTKMPAAADASGIPIRLRITAGQASEYGHFMADYALADRVMILICFVASIAEKGAKPVIEPQRTKLPGNMIMSFIKNVILWQNSFQN